MKEIIRRIERLEIQVAKRQTKPRARSLERVLEKAAAAVAGKSLPPADWAGVDAATIAHRARLLASIEAINKSY